MADTAGHDEQMKNFMRTKISVMGIENRKFKSIDNSANCVNDSTGQKQCKST